MADRKKHEPKRKSRVIPEEDVYLVIAAREARKLQRIAKKKQKELKDLANERIKAHGAEVTKGRTDSHASHDKIAAEQKAEEFWFEERQKLSKLDPVDSLCDAIEVIHLDEVLRAKADADRVESCKLHLLDHQKRLHTGIKRLEQIVEEKMKETLQELDTSIKTSNDRIDEHIGANYFTKLCDTESLDST